MNVSLFKYVLNNGISVFVLLVILFLSYRFVDLKLNHMQDELNRSLEPKSYQISATVSSGSGDVSTSYFFTLYIDEKSKDLSICPVD